MDYAPARISQLGLRVAIVAAIAAAGVAIALTLLVVGDLPPWTTEPIVAAPNRWAA